MPLCQIGHCINRLSPLLFTIVKTIKSELGALAQGRKILEHGDSYQLREELGTYIAHFEGKNGNIGGENGYFLDVND
ncbi:MAG: hypothetical protein R8K48_08115 [Gallionella sp.]